MAHYVQLTLHTQPSGRVVWLKCLKTTAEFYGWLDAYPHSEELATHPFQQRVFRGYPTTPFRPDIGGKSRRIYRSNSRDGYPRGQTNRFRICSQVTNRQLAELAAMTKVPFRYMESVGGARISYDRWMNAYISGKL